MLGRCLATRGVRVRRFARALLLRSRGACTLAPAATSSHAWWHAQQQVPAAAAACPAVLVQRRGKPPSGPSAVANPRRPSGCVRPPPCPPSPARSTPQPVLPPRDGAVPDRAAECGQELAGQRADHGVVPRGHDPHGAAKNAGATTHACTRTCQKCRGWPCCGVAALIGRVQRQPRRARCAGRQGVRGGGLRLGGLAQLAGAAALAQSSSGPHPRASRRALPRLGRPAAPCHPSSGGLQHAQGDQGRGDHQDVGPRRPGGAAWGGWKAGKGG